MEQACYRDRLSERHGLRVIVPDEADRAIIHRIIYEELCLGVVRAESWLEYQRIMNELARQGAQAIILGCTEITLLVGAEDAALPLFDTTAIHAQMAAEEALTPQESNRCV
jgi:aspartate racemase